MGKAARWLRNLLGGGGKKEQGREREQRRPATTNNAAAPSGDRKRWSFCKSSSRDTSEPEVTAAAQVGANNGVAAIARAAEAAWLRSLYKETEREQSKHAIAVAAATAVAADAAVAAAQAAVEVVRLTSQGPLVAATSPRAFAGAGGDGRAAAAVRIQTAFRGYLAKKALRALKALVKLQALVRGYLVRKQAAATLQSMQALVRAQAAIRAAARNRAADLRLHLHPLTVRPPRYSLQEDTRSEHGSGVAPYYYSRRLSASVESSSYGYDRSPKIVEMDTARPKSRSSSLPVAEPGGGDDYGYYSVSSPLMPCGHGLPCAPPRIAAPSRGFFLPEYYEREKPRPATAQSTPRYASSLYYTPVTPAKSVCGVGGYSNNSPSTLLSGPRSYMSSTQSSDAKTRSQSAPKQRPEEGGAVPPRKRVPLREVVLEARASLSGATQRYYASSCNNSNNRPPREEAGEKFSFKKAVVSRFDRSSEPAVAADRDRDMFLQKGW